MRKVSTFVLFLFLCSAWISIGKLKMVKADSTDYVRFSSGVTIFSPINTTYNSRFLNLNLTFDQGAGIDCSLNYSMDGNYEGSIPLLAKNATGFQVIYEMTGLVTLPELSEGSHCLTVNVLCGLYDYHGAYPPGAPFKPTSPGGSDYIATWTHTIYFTIDTSIQEVTSSSNWSEVTRFTGSESEAYTTCFTCDHVEWRIRWEFDPGHWHFADLHFLNITIYPEGEVTNYFDQIYGSGNRNSGIR